MAVQFIQARVTNPGRPGRASATTPERKMRKPRRKIKVLVGRKTNPAKKRAKPSKKSLVKRTSARVKSLLARLHGKPPKRRKSRKASSKVVVARAANPRRRRNGIARRRHNPGFDVKNALITGAVLIAGTYVGLQVVPFIEKKLAELAPETFTGKTLGYTLLLGAAVTVVGGNYLQARFGSKKVDLAPAAYALAAIMAIRGLRKAELIASDVPMLGYGHGMRGTLEFGTNAYGGSGAGYQIEQDAISGHNYGMGNLPRGYSMLGTIQTADMLPSPPVGPHNVMQGYHGASLI